MKKAKVKKALGWFIMLATLGVFFACMGAEVSAELILIIASSAAIVGLLVLSGLLISGGL